MSSNKQVPAGEFKAKCLKLMDIVEQDRVEIVITKRGKPIAKLLPYEDTPPALSGYLRDTVKIIGDILSPLPDEWEAVNE